jgi:hypothetical protein
MATKAKTKTAAKHGDAEPEALRFGRSAIHGTGVFANRRFEQDDVIERCPVLTLSGPDADAVIDTVLGNYVYEWEHGYALALGYGSLYNHSHQPSARYEMDYDHDEIHVVSSPPHPPRRGDHHQLQRRRRRPGPRLVRGALRPGARTRRRNRRRVDGPRPWPARWARPQ